MNDPIKISVLGASGRMGQMLLKAVMENKEKSGTPLKKKGCKYS